MDVEDECGGRRGQRGTVKGERAHSSTVRSLSFISKTDFKNSLAPSLRTAKRPRNDEKLFEMNRVLCGSFTEWDWKGKLYEYRGEIVR